MDTSSAVASTEIIWFTSDSYRNDPTILDAPIKVLKDSGGLVQLYQGSQMENPQVSVAILLWKDAGAHTKFAMDAAVFGPFMQAFAGSFNPGVAPLATHVEPEGGQAELAHILKAPCVEITYPALKSGVAWAAVKSVLAEIKTALKDVKSCHGVSFVQDVRTEEDVVLVVGWDSPEARAQIDATKTGPLSELLARYVELLDLEKSSIKHIIDLKVT